MEVNDIIITSPETDEKWGISESALALLRTLKYNHPDEVKRRWRSEKDSIMYPITSIKLPNRIYKEKILEFALQAKEFYKNNDKIIDTLATKYSYMIHKSLTCD